jgi:hypothetical protein
MWAPSEHPKQRTEAQILRSLVENGVAKRFDLRAWSDAGCKQATAAERLHALLEQVRPDVAKLIVLEELEVRSRSPAIENESKILFQESAYRFQTFGSAAAAARF